MSFSTPSEQFEELDSPSIILTELPGNEDLSTLNPMGWASGGLLIETDHISAPLSPAVQVINPNLLSYFKTNHLIQPTDHPKYDEDEALINPAGEKAQGSAVETELSYGTRPQLMTEIPGFTEDPSDVSNVDAIQWDVLDGPTPMA
ncbi:hypothetical protein CFIO01_06226 [Colletotrichum fioriniae PJ7]|uniref:Uncharacterized protein n=1 Tax=Colletotrichum fioriniae PJ7 TaxID=1445577 RepID=A0A010RXU1_9PEZI|nr:hypothetical protein CFIO01_06226 [Colletotrichum fioriniae PJ7]